MGLTALPKRFQQERLWLTLGWLLAGLLLISLFWLNHNYQNNRTNERLIQRLDILHTNLAHQLETIDYLLQQGSAFLEQSSERALNPRTLQLLPQLTPGIQTINVLSAQGKVLQSSNPVFVGTNYAHRDYFNMAQQADNRGRLLVSSPFMGERDGWLMVLARAYYDTNDHFAGLVSTTLSPRKFSTLLASVQYNEHMQSQLVHDNGLEFLAINHHHIQSTPFPLAAEHPVQKFLQSDRSQSLWHSQEHNPHNANTLAIRQLCLTEHCLPLNIALGVHQSPLAGQLLTSALAPLLLWLIVGLGGHRLLNINQQRRQQITENHHQTRLLEQRLNQNWRNLLELIGQAVWEWDRQSGQVIYSLPWKQRLGFAEAEVSNLLEEWRQRVHPDDIQAVSRALQDYVDGLSSSYQCSYRLRTRSGDYIKVLDRAIIIERDQRGYPTHLIGTHVDVSPIQQESKMLEQLATHLPGVLYQYHLDLQGNFHFPYASSSLEGIYGHSIELLNADPSLLARLVHSQDRDALFDGLHESARNLTSWRMDYRVTLPDGRERWIRDHANPVRLTDGSTLWHGHLQDITASHRQAMQLAETEQLLKHLMNELPIGLAMLDEKNTLHFSNRWFSRMFPLRLPLPLEDWLQQAVPHSLPREQILQQWLADRKQAEQGDGYMPTRQYNFLKESQTIDVSLSGLTFGHHCLIILEDRSAQENQHAFLHTLAYQDALTGLANRRHLDETLQSEWRRCRRSGKPLSALMIDIDFFKAFNDLYGHQAGDHCLARIGKAMRTTSQRAQDLVARYGGEEFVCLLPEASLSEACLMAEKLRRTVEQLNIQHQGSPQYGRVTISIGVCSTVPTSNSNASELIRVADDCLYQAKQAGRNQVAGCPCPAEHGEQ